MIKFLNRKTTKTSNANVTVIIKFHACGLWSYSKLFNSNNKDHFYGQYVLMMILNSQNSFLILLPCRNLNHCYLPGAGAQ